MKCNDDYLIVEVPQDGSCANHSCNCGGLTKTVIPAALGDDSAESDARPKNGAFCNKIVEYEANGAVYIYSGDGLWTKIKEGSNHGENQTN